MGWDVHNRSSRDCLCECVCQSGHSKSDLSASFLLACLLPCCWLPVPDLPSWPALLCRFPPAQTGQQPSRGARARDALERWTINRPGTTRSTGLPLSVSRLFCCRRAGSGTSRGENGRGWTGCVVQRKAKAGKGHRGGEQRQGATQ